MMRCVFGVRGGAAPFFALFFFNDTATTEIYTLSLHDALPIYPGARRRGAHRRRLRRRAGVGQADRKSTRLNSSHHGSSYAVFCLKKKKERGAVVPDALDDGHHDGGGQAGQEQ